MERFLELTDLKRLDYQPEQVALFMTAEGNVTLNWPKENGEIVEIEFSNENIEYFNETTEEERVFFLSQADDLVSILYRP